MVLTEANGTITTTTSAQDLFDITALKHFATTVYTHNMVAGDEIELIVYVLDSNGSTMRKYRTKRIKDAQTDPAFFIPFLPASQYKVTIQRIAGTDRAYTWTRHEE